MRQWRRIPIAETFFCAKTEDADWTSFVFMARSLAFDVHLVARAGHSWKGAHEERSFASFLCDDWNREGSASTRVFDLKAFSFVETIEEYGDGSLGGGGGGELLLSACAFGLGARASKGGAWCIAMRC